MNLSLLRLSVVGLATILATAGCGDSNIGDVAPVSGKVSVGGKPLTGGVITFVPDSTKGGGEYSPSGSIGPDGTYTLSTSGRGDAEAGGAPLGHYKVIILTQFPGMTAATPPTKIDPKYSNPSKTPLSVEVTEDATAGAYDFDIK